MTLESFSPNQARMARQFLLNLFAPYEEGYVEFRWKRPEETGNMCQRFVSLKELRERTDAIILSLLINAKHSDMYVGALPRSARSGKQSDVGQAAWYWADIDFKQWPDVPLSDAQAHPAWEFTEGADIVVGSGGGLHCYWYAGATLDLTGAMRGAFTNRLKAWQGKMRSDNVADLPRILRVPGTFNWKNGGRRPVRLLRCLEISK